MTLKTPPTKSVILKLAILLVIQLWLISCGVNQSGFTYTEAKKLESLGWQQVPEILERINPPDFPERAFNILDYGAKGDSIANDLPAILAAIKACSEEGGGKVIVPPGYYLMDGPIHLESNVNLHLEDGARVFFSSRPESYLPAVKVRWEGTVCYNYSPLIYAYQKENIALTGTGEIDGRAKKWSMDWRELQKPDKKRLRKMGNDTIPEHERVFANGFLDLQGDGKDDGFGDGKAHYLRPTLVEFYECKNILIEDLTFKNSPFWTIHPVFSKNTTIRNLKVFGESLNDDGIDPDSCEDVLIEGCLVQTHDDAISIKAGRDQDAWNSMGSKNIIVRNNELLSGVNALCIGSEMSGGVSNVFAENNKIAGGKHALNFKCNLDRGGQVQNVYLRNTEIESCEDAVFIFRMDYHGYRGNNFPTKFNDFYVSGITCGKVDRKPFKIVGVKDEPISRIFLNDIEVDSAGEESQVEYAEDIVFNQVLVNGDEIN
ncbi:MAG: glycoside hydrolase family 28 protein [Bacteroidota bacterium]